MKRRNFIETISGTAILLGLYGCDIPNPYDVAPKVVRPIDPKIISTVFIFDSSSSMDEELGGVRKINLAKNAMIDSALPIYKAHNDISHNVEVGILYFGPWSKVISLVPLEAYNHDLLVSKVRELEPHSGTPLGEALALAERELDEKAKGRKNIVMLTDGENTVGHDPEEVYNSIINTNKSYGDSPTSLYLIAFNTDEKYFTGLKDLGAVVIGAQDGHKLQSVFGDTSKRILEMPIP